MNEADEFEQLEEKEKQMIYKAARRVGVISLLLLPFTFAYLEIILRVTAGDHFGFLTTAGMLLLSFGAGFLCDLICTAFPHIAARWICFSIAEIATLVFLLMYFVNNSYRTYMDPASLVTGTGYVVEGFARTIAATIRRGIPMILLYHIPSAVILYLTIRRFVLITHRGKWQSVSCAILAALMLVSAPFIMTAEKMKRDQYTAEFSFDTAVRTFGLTTALKLDTVYSVFGNPFDKIGFDIPDIPYDEDTLRGDELLPGQPDEPEEPIVLPGDEMPEPEPEPIVYGYNGLDIDYLALADATKDKTLADLYRYIASQSPSMQNEYTGLFKGKNLILMTAEAFSKEVIDEERTPALYRMATKGIVFEDYYQPAWGGSTSTGEFSVITGILPVNKVASVKQTIGHNMYLTMGSQLMRLGYKSGAYHNGSYTYYGRNLTHENFGYSKFIGMGNGLEKGVTDCWPESDDELFRYIMPEYIESGEPFSIYCMTVSGHCGYSVGGNNMSRKNYSVVKDMDASEVIKCYHAANYELELAMEYLIGALEDAGIADDTVIVISTDHYPYGLEDSAAWGTDRDYLKELYGYPANSNTARDHSALIIWCGCLEDRDEPIVVSEPTYSLDIIPTLSNLFGVEYDSRLLFGRDVFSDAEPLVLWQDHSWKTDKGYYNAATGVFTANDGGTVDKVYIERIKSVVRNKFTFAKGVLAYDFYGLLFN